MLFKRTILTKILSTGMKAEFAIVKEAGAYKAALYINGRRIPGPPLPEKLDPPTEGLTHWMGNRPSVGLSSDEAEKIIREVELENSVLEHLRKERRKP
ncbi:hypothetical protein [Geobacter sp. SVR]|uniref:hypothetical protein n=1 Tax=Geobacter sp. SVR TaxID=2495594 RepID=UPI00143EFB97|nr:hypothetical protein [Geobacter sp. SVR]BCS53652.1 hypothetical protein GSVR_19600 [Geobacter sp. SVR]GCF84151.1 hypothetical protein GSbR_07510 [Geobacter sp. SVR]